MRFGEDLKVSTRSIQRRLVESVLLIIGIALGIGATAAGFAMVVSSLREAKELLFSTRYREIVVTLQESAEEMDLPAVRQESTERIVLTSADLAAGDVSEDVQYAYLMNGARFHLGVPNARQLSVGPGAEGQPGPSMTFQIEPGPGGQTPLEGESPLKSADGESQEGAPPLDLAPSPEAPSPGAPQAGTPPGGAPQPGDRASWLQLLQQIPAPEGPEPVLEEMGGYMVSPEFFDAWSLHAAEGSLFSMTDMEKGEPLLVLGSELAAALFEDGISLGREVLMQMQLYKIVGILEPTGTDFDRKAFVPVVMPDIQGMGGDLRGMIRRMTAWNTNLHFTVKNSDRLDEARSQLASWFDSTYGPGLVNIRIPREEAEQARDRTARLITIIMFLAFSGLLIASVNVSNILLSRVIRKRRSVGILKALGATVAAVFRVFFVEALFISLGGAVVGSALSVVLSRLIETTMGFATISGLMRAVGVFLSWIITTTLTILPSIQASRIPAAEAIRYE